MKSQLFKVAIRSRSRSSSLTSTPPAKGSEEYSPRLASIAAQILYRNPLPSQNDLPLFILNAAALPSAKDDDFDALLPYVLARLPDEEELIGGKGYEVVFFAGEEEAGATTIRKDRPGWGWFIQAYHVLGRAMRKRLQHLYIVHERTWVRVMVEMFSTIVSPKFRKKIVHCSSLTALALHMPIEDLVIYPSTYLFDRRNSPAIYVPYTNGKRAFGVPSPLHESASGWWILPRVLRESTSFILMDECVKTEGVFRVNARGVVVDVLQECYERGQKFIAWRENDSILISSHWQEGHGNIITNQVDQPDGFGAHAAAALIKRWYSVLLEPLFPPSTYDALRNLPRGAGTADNVSHLKDLLDPASLDSPLPSASRFILVMHLIPLLNKVAKYEDENQMGLKNLATCFAPNLVRGKDPFEDVEMSSRVATVLENAARNWSSLADSMNVSSDIYHFLSDPVDPSDREDPPQEMPRPTSAGAPVQQSGIVMLDRDEEIDCSDSDEESVRPDLPPRPSVSLQGGKGREKSPKRKPAPKVQNPPRYSSIFQNGSNILDDSAGYEQHPSPTDLTETATGSTEIPSAVQRRPLPKPAGDQG
ncbi:hypothetical protein MMC25_006953 [Agyrium rufum]|nr:hypothetical protein [Agyrium rufum]